MNTQNNIEKLFTRPNDIISEQILLAGLIYNSKLRHNTIGVTNPEIFSNENHKSIFRAIVNLHNNKREIGFLQIRSWLTQHNNNKCQSDIEAIENIGSQIVNNEVFSKHLYIVLDKFIRRSLIEDIQLLLNKLAHETTSITSIINDIESIVLKLTQRNTNKVSKTALQSVLPSIINEIKQKNTDNNTINGLPSGFDNLDKITDGFQKSDLIIIASRPGMGKTAFVLNIARSIVKTNKAALVFFSLEMTAEQIGYRILSGESRVPLSQLKQGKIIQKEWRQIQKAVQLLSKTKLYIDDTPNITITGLRNQIYQLSQSDIELKAVIVDYLQLIESNLGTESRYQQLSFITRSLKIIAREFNIPVIVLSQLSRNLETRSNKRPILADLRESGCIAPHSYIICNTQNTKLYKFSLPLHTAVPTMNSNNSIVTSSIKNIFDSKNKMSYQLYTKSGYSIEASANHKIWTLQGWKKLSQITTQEFIGITCRYKKTKITSICKIEEFFNLKFDKIESICVNKKQNLFDLEMSIMHNFVANKIVVHNSIEQDADIVCMLYREAYYEVEETNNNIAEVAVLKHRNGPTGKIELVFDNKFAEFTQHALKDLNPRH